MSETLNSIVGKRNDFATRAIGGGTVSSGASGVILTLTPPTGQRVRLTHLSTTDNVFASEGVISVFFDSVKVVNQVTLYGYEPTFGSFSVGSFQDYAAANPPIGNFKYFTGAVDEVLTVDKAIGNTTFDVYYGYEFGE